MANNNISKKEMKQEAGKEFLSVREVAAMSGYSYGTIKRAIEQGKLSAYRIGRKFFIDAAAAEKRRTEKLQNGAAIYCQRSRFSGFYAKKTSLIIYMQIIPKSSRKTGVFRRNIALSENCVKGVSRCF